MSSPRPPFDDREAIFRRYLVGIEHAPLLTRDQEIQAAALVDDGRAAENELAALLGSSVADLARVSELRDRIRAGDDARADLIAATRRLVVSLARNHDHGADRAALLLEAGQEALSRAVDRYDPAGGLPFSSFARWWIERAMREVELHPVSGGRPSLSPADPTLLTALGHLHEQDCEIVELRLGLTGAPPLTRDEMATHLGVAPDVAAEREDKALAKLRHPCTPGDLTDLRKL